MKVFNENVKTKTHKGDRNMLVVETKHEIFFGVFNVKLNGKFYVAEQVAEFDGTPILKLPVEINGVIEERLFDVVVGSDTGIVFNPDITSEQMLESATNVNENPLDIDEVFKPKVIEEDISMSEEDVSELIYGNTKEQPSNFDTESPLKYGNTTRDIDQIVLNLEKSIGSLQEKAQSTIKDYTNRQLKKLKQLSENGIQNSPQFIETAKTELVSEFVKITENIKSELSQSNINSRKDISNTLEYKLANAVNEFDEKIKTQFENYSQIYNDTISQYIDTIFETTVKPATSGLMLQVSEDLNSQVEEFKTEVSESLSDKISNNELREFEEIFSDNSQRLISANIDLNNKIDQISKKIITEAIIDNKIADNIKKIEEHFDTNITAVSEKADTLDEATREYLLSVIAESRQTLLNEISAIKDNVAVEYIVENKKKTEKLDVLTLKSELQKDLDLKVSNAIVNLKKFTAYYGGGGGTVAVQFADGGTMNGNLTVVGAISASQYLGLSYLLNDYLPLSGGTVTGNVTVTGSVSADRIYTTQLDALSANITVIDIKQYELSGFNVTGDVTINGSVSAQNISAANLYSSNAVTIGGNLTVDTNTLFVDSVNNRVGIGTISPAVNFHVSEGISRFERSSVVFNITPNYTGLGNVALDVSTNNGIIFRTNNTDRAVISNTGSVGIGTTAPTAGYTLDVVGAAKIGGNILCGGSILYLNSQQALTQGTNSLTLGAATYFTTINYGNASTTIHNFAAGKVGIGTATPAAKFEVWTTYIGPTIPALGASNIGFSFLEVAGKYGLIGGVLSNGNCYLQAQRVDATATAYNLLLQSNGGNVGIGTATPSTPLHTYTAGNNSLTIEAGTGDSQVMLRSGGSQRFLFGYEDADDGFRIYNNTTASTALFVKSTTGNVGIGTTTPNEKLTVVGNISAIGNVAVTGHFSAATKSFKIPHQSKGGHLQYGVVESDCHSVLVRGKISSDTITLPEHWSWLVDADSVTVQLTPVGCYQQLYIVSSDNQTVKVGGVTGEYCYVVYGTRKDVAPLEVEIE
jgi:hypothetical protein